MPEPYSLIEKPFAYRGKGLFYYEITSINITRKMLHLAFLPV